MICTELPPFAATRLAVVRHAFQHTAPCALHQAWLPKREASFASAMVRTGWRADALLVFAELDDVDIYNLATSRTQRTWELGDTFEMLLQHENQAGYVELHVTPNNLRLQLRYEDAAMVEDVRTNGSFENALIPGNEFYSATWLEPEAQRWFVYAEVPAALVGGPESSLGGNRWCYSFSRYDYTRGRVEPVISSTSAHAEPDFHRQHEWGVLAFQPSNTRSTL